MLYYYFFILQSVPTYMHMLRHLVRSEIHAKTLLPKSFLRTAGPIKATIGHYPIRCFGNEETKCQLDYADVAMAHLAHYRDGCQKGVNEWCDAYTNSTVEDRAILKFKDKLVTRVKRTLRDLGFIRS